jgi:hypothetical protein
LAKNKLNAILKKTEHSDMIKSLPSFGNKGRTSTFIDHIKQSQKSEMDYGSSVSTAPEEKL